MVGGETSEEQCGTGGRRGQLRRQHRSAPAALSSRWLARRVWGRVWVGDVGGGCAWGAWEGVGWAYYPERRKCWEVGRIGQRQRRACRCGSGVARTTRAAAGGHTER